MFVSRQAAFSAVLLLALPAHAELVFAQTHQSATHACAAGEHVLISGSGNTLRLSGPCGQVDITGSENRLAMAQAQVLNMSGKDNVVSWTGTKPVIHDLGTGNQLAGRAIMQGSHAPGSSGPDSVPAPAPHL